MQFTREPVIETVIVAKEGFKLALHNSRKEQETFSVDALEVVSIGNAYFYRSLEKPKSFLLPVLEYSITEVRESRMVLKTPTAAEQQGIKIAGGKEAVLKPSKKAEPSAEEADQKKQRPSKRRAEKAKTPEEESSIKKAAKERTIIPPPSLLISETLSQDEGTEFASEANLVEENTTEETNQQL